MIQAIALSVVVSGAAITVRELLETRLAKGTK